MLLRRCGKSRSKFAPVNPTLDLVVMFHTIEQIMNIVDSDSVATFKRPSDKQISVPDTAMRKPSALKARLAKILTASGVKPFEKGAVPTHFTFGVKALDKALCGSAAQDGLPGAALHEIHAAEKDDMTSAAAVALLLAERSRALGQGDMKNGPILWISESGEARRQGRLYPPGLVELGINPDHIIHVDAPDSIAVLRAAADSVRSSVTAAVIVELAGKKPKGLNLTATRRLSLSAQKSAVLTLLLRSGTSQDDPLPTAAFSRWEICAAPSIPLAAGASGHPAFDITLLRHRSGLYGLKARLEWSREHREFREWQGEETMPDIGDFSSFPAIRTDQQDTRAA